MFNTQEEQEEYENAMIEAFVNKPEKTEWYKNAFSKYNINGIDTMKWVWSWWAFFGTWAFLLYRKQYIPAIVLFLLSIVGTVIPFLHFIISLLAGGFSTYFVYKGYKKKKEEIESTINNPQLRIETMREVGGYNPWVAWVYGTFIALLFLYITFMVVAVITNSAQ